jgi:mannose-6-phosphate isomerase-like protein (cupin superfamily)
MATTTTIVRNVEDMESRWFYGGGTHLWLAGEDETRGGFMLFEDRMVSGKSTPLHTHPHEESFYVVEGVIRLHVHDEQQELRAGGFAVVPRDTPHAFLVTSDEARVLSLHTPAGGEAFFRSASEPVMDGGTHPGVDFAKVIAAGIETGAMTVVGPPPF